MIDPVDFRPVAGTRGHDADLVRPPALQLAQQLGVEAQLQDRSRLGIRRQLGVHHLVVVVPQTAAARHPQQHVGAAGPAAAGQPRLGDDVSPFGQGPERRRETLVLRQFLHPQALAPQMVQVPPLVLQPLLLQAPPRRGRAGRACRALPWRGAGRAGSGGGSRGVWRDPLRRGWNRRRRYACRGRCDGRVARATAGGWFHRLGPAELAAGPTSPPWRRSRPRYLLRASPPRRLVAASLARRSRHPTPGSGSASW